MLCLLLPYEVYHIHIIKNHNLHLRVIQEGLYNYVGDIMNNLRSLKFNSILTQFVFIGGGATIIKNFLRTQEENITIINDIFINAKGYEEILRHKYKVG